MSNRMMKILVPVISIILGLLVGAIVMVLSGYDPIKAYIALWDGIFGSPCEMGETVRQISPYLLAGLAVAFTYRTRLFTIGVEGQIIDAWIASPYEGMALKSPHVMH